MKTIEENNKLIAEFMNKSYSANSFKTPNLPQIKELEYHTSWNDLMPVVEKIESLNFEYKNALISFDVTIIYGDCIIRDDNGRGFELSKHSIDSSSKISAVYEAVVEFIKWYNENK